MANNFLEEIKQQERLEAEDILLSIADSIWELRKLREENKELREFRDKYYQEVSERARDASMHSANLLKIMLMEGMTQEEKENFINK